jgi:hypothetical protein
MVVEAKLEPGWLTRDVNNAAARAKALDSNAASQNQASQSPSQQKKPSVPPQSED